MAVTPVRHIFDDAEGPDVFINALSLEASPVISIPMDFGVKSTAFGAEDVNRLHDFRPVFRS